MPEHHEDEPRVPLTDCVKGRVYSVGGGELKVGVFNGVEGFIGIRTRGKTRILDLEHYWEIGVIDDLKVDVPEDIEILMYLPSEHTSYLDDNAPLFKFLEEIENTKAP